MERGRPLGSKNKYASYRKGKSYEEIYGKKKAAYLKNKHSVDMKGENNPFFGQHHTKKTRRILRISHVGKKATLETRKKISKGHRKHNTQETKKKISIANSGKNNGMYNHKYTKEEKKLHSQAIIRNAANNPNFGTRGKPYVWKKISAALQGVSLSEWKGLSKEPYDETFNNTFKNQIRKRDNQICMNCGSHREKLKEALHIHHINYDKKLSLPENCISLCRCCHALTLTNREYWTKFFQDLLSQKYNYKYKNGKVIIKI